MINCNPSSNNNVNISSRLMNEPSVAVNPLSNANSKMSIVVAANDMTNGIQNCRIGVYWSKDANTFENDDPRYSSTLPFVNNGKIILEPPLKKNGYDRDFTFVADPSVDSGFRGPSNYDPNSFLIAGVAGIQPPNGPPTDGTIVVYRPLLSENPQQLENDPLTWQPPVIVSPGNGLEINNDKPFLAIDKSGGSPFLGRSYITYMRRYLNWDLNPTPPGGTAVFFQRSEDTGATWSNPIRLSEPFNPLSDLKLGTGQVLLFTNSTIEYDTTTGAPPLIAVGDTITLENVNAGTFKITNNSGTINDTVAVGIAYKKHGLSFKIYRAYGFNPGNRVTFEIKDVSGSISTPYPNNGSVWGSSISVGPEGQVYVAWVETDVISEVPGSITASLKVCRSDDGGVTFHPTVNVTSFMSIPSVLSGPSVPGTTAPAWVTQANTNANISVDTSNGDFKGRVYVVWQAMAFDRRSAKLFPNVVMSFSDDKGVTWSSPKVISQIGNNIFSFLPSIAVSRNTGKVGIVYYSNFCATNATPPTPESLDVLGVEWKGDIPSDFSNQTIRLTDKNNRFNPSDAIPRNSSITNWLGDFISAAIVPPDSLIAVWTSSTKITNTTTGIITPFDFIVSVFTN